MRLVLTNITGIDAEFLQFFLVIALVGGSHTQLSTKVTVYLKYT